MIDLSCHLRLIERAMYSAKELVDPRSLTKLVDRYLFSCILLLPEHPGVGPISALLFWRNPRGANAGLYQRRSVQPVVAIAGGFAICISSGQGGKAEN